MLLLPPLLAAASCLCSAALAYKEERICYGDTFRLPFDYSPPVFMAKLVFTPTSGRGKQVVIENKKVKDPRYKSRHSSVRLEGVTSRDDGIFSTEFDGGRKFDVIRLVILECGETIERSYYGTFRRTPVDFEYVEYSDISDPEVLRPLWNRSDPGAGGGRAQLKRNTWEMKALTTADSGFYNFMLKDNRLSSRIKLLVTEHRLERTVEESHELYISYPGRDLSKAFWKVTFTNEVTRVLMEDGRWLEEDGYYHARPNFMSRIDTSPDSFSVSPVTPAYTGTYEFRDRDGSLVLFMEVFVTQTPNYWYVAICAGVALLIVIGCCCCVKKCCCKKAASKRRAPAPQAAAAPTYHHGATQPSGPAYSAHSYSASPAVAPSYRPLNPVSSGGETHNPLTYNAALIHENAPQPSPAPQFTAPVPSFSMGTDCLSSDAEPRFELKGMTFLSNSPLGSDATTSDVYTSDKLNFL